MKHLLTLRDWDTTEIKDLLTLAAEIKANPATYEDATKRKTMIMIFQKPSLRTRVSFETGMTQMGGYAIYYNATMSPMGAGKETASDTAECISRYVDLVVARMFEHAHIEELAEHASVPVVNALTNFSHPCQILADLFTINEQKGGLKGLKLAYLGDSNNNVTHSLLFGCAHMGLDISVGCPEGAEYSPLPEVLADAGKIAATTGSKIAVSSDPFEAVDGADVVYTDSWMSYHIPKEQLDARVAVFNPYQVNSKIMQAAAKDAIFMNCLPAQRGYEQTEDVIDGPQSVVFEQAENRLCTQKALLVKLIGHKAKADSCRSIFSFFKC